jgi:hypothetical protein
MKSDAERILKMDTEATEAITGGGDTAAQADSGDADSAESGSNRSLDGNDEDHWSGSDDESAEDFEGFEGEAGEEGAGDSAHRDRNHQEGTKEGVPTDDAAIGKSRSPQLTRTLSTAKLDAALAVQRGTARVCKDDLKSKVSNDFHHIQSSLLIRLPVNSHILTCTHMPPSSWLARTISRHSLFYSLDTTLFLRT